MTRKSKTFWRGESPKHKKLPDAKVLNVLCLLKGKKRVKLHWRKAGVAYWSESWDAAEGGGPSGFSKWPSPEQLGYVLERITFENSFG